MKTDRILLKSRNAQLTLYPMHPVRRRSHAQQNYVGYLMPDGNATLRLLS